MPCLIVRGPHGGFCGYVGVMPGHPLHGKDYSECPEACGSEWCDHRPESSLEAHGGITFASACAHIAGEEHWRKFCANILARRDEAKRYPQGDAATALKDWAAGLESYDAWAERMKATRVCHIPAPGESDSVWWFGFDCAHSGDLCPSYARKFRGGMDEQYRDLAYVTEQCQALAQQLRTLAA